MAKTKEQQEVLTDKKRFEAYLILNWKSKEVRVIKKQPRDKSPWDIVVKVNILVKMPKLKTHQVKGEIMIPEKQVKEMFIEEV